MSLNLGKRTISALGIGTFVGLVAAVAPSQAAVIVVPPSLNPGDSFRLAFLTSTTQVPSSVDIDDYNLFVTEAATGGTSAIDTALDIALADVGIDPNSLDWKVIGSTVTVDARDNTGTNPTIETGVPIFRLDGASVADNNADLWDGSIDNQILINEEGQDTCTPISCRPYTGSISDGTRLIVSGGGGALGDTISLGNLLVGVGDPTNSFISTFPFVWIEGGTLSGSPQPYYALSPVLQVPNTSVPEPSLLLGLIGMGGAALFKRPLS